MGIGNFVELEASMTTSWWSVLHPRLVPVPTVLVASVIDELTLMLFRLL